MVRLGDVLHLFGIFIVFSQFFAMMTDTKGKTKIFSEFYSQEGFCRSTEEEEGFDSFKLCFIVDTFYCIFAFLFIKSFPHTDKLKPDSQEILKALPGVFFSRNGSSWPILLPNR